MAALGYLSIVFVMFSGARRLGLHQNKTYGNDPEYQAYVKNTPHSDSIPSHLIRLPAINGSRLSVFKNPPFCFGPAW